MEHALEPEVYESVLDLVDLYKELRAYAARQRREPPKTVDLGVANPNSPTWEAYFDDVNDATQNELEDLVRELRKIATSLLARVD